MTAGNFVVGKKTWRPSHQNSTLKCFIGSGPEGKCLIWLGQKSHECCWLFWDQYRERNNWCCFSSILFGSDEELWRSWCEDQEKVFNSLSLLFRKNSSDVEQAVLVKVVVDASDIFPTDFEPIRIFFFGALLSPFALPFPKLDLLCSFEAF